MKRLLFASAALLAVSAASADTYPYLSFQSTDGTTVSVEVESLSMVFSDSGKTLVVSNGSESHTLDVAYLSKMFFSENPATGISDVHAAGNSSGMQVFTLSGTLVGQYSSRGSLEENVEPGIYLVKENGVTKKIAVR